MAGNTPQEAYENFRAPLVEALGCVTAGRLTVPTGRDFRVGPTYSVVLGRGDPVPLKRIDHPRIFLSAGHRFRIVQPQEPDRGPYKVQTIEYWYSFSEGAGGEQEILSFHWTPETEHDGERRYPHLHIKPANVGATTLVDHGRMGKLHIPTGRVSLESVIRFSIEELHVQPLSRRKDWRSILDRTEDAFNQHRRRETNR